MHRRVAIRRLARPGRCPRFLPRSPSRRASAGDEGRRRVPCARPTTRTARWRSRRRTAVSRGSTSDRPTSAAAPPTSTSPTAVGARRIYVGYATSGVWKTDDNGATWQSIFDDQRDDAASATSPSPRPTRTSSGSAPAKRTCSARSMPGVGIYKSVNGGRTFTHSGLTDTHTIPRIIVHPTNPDVVYVAASGHGWTENEMRGVFKTTDGGRTWDEGALSRPERRRHRSRHGSVRSQHAVRRDLAADAAQVERPAGRAGIDRERTLEDDRRGQDLESDQRGAAGGAVPRAARDRRRALESERAVRLPRQLRSRDARPARASATRTDGRSPRRASRRPRSTAPTTRARHGARSASSDEFMTNHSGTYGWVFGQIRVDPTDENTIYSLGLGLNVSSDARQDVHRAARHARRSSRPVDRSAS